MRRRIALLVLLICCSSVSAAPTIRLRVGSESGILHPGAGIPTRSALHSAPGDLLNCENDNLVEPANSLMLSAGDLAGVIFELPTPLTRYRIRELRLGFVDVGATYPTDIDLQFFQLDESGSGFSFVSAFTITLSEPLNPSDPILQLDLRNFDLRVSDELLVLYGQVPITAIPNLRPGADSSSHCADDLSAQACSVLLPAGSSVFSAYGMVDAVACPAAQNNFQHFDIVMELEVAELALPTLDSSWSALKSRYSLESLNR